MKKKEARFCSGRSGLEMEVVRVEVCLPGGEWREGRRESSQNPGETGSKEPLARRDRWGL